MRIITEDAKAFSCFMPRFIKVDIANPQTDELKQSVINLRDLISATEGKLGPEWSILTVRNGSDVTTKKAKISIDQLWKSVSMDIAPIENSVAQKKKPKSKNKPNTKDKSKGNNKK